MKLKGESICVRYGSLDALRAAGLELAAGEMVGLIGPNGSGKSTLVRALLGLQPMTSGRVTVDGRAIGELARTELARCMAYLPQSGEVRWPLTVIRVVELGRLPHRAPWRRPGPADREAVGRAMAQTGVVHLADRPLSTLSGGERLRVHLARVLAGEPALLLADEPVAALDPYHQLSTMGLLRRHADAGHGVLVILHDLSLASRFCHRLVLLHQGRVMAAGAPASVLTADNLAAAYHISAHSGDNAGEHFIIPWSTHPAAPVPE